MNDKAKETAQETTKIQAQLNSFKSSWAFDRPLSLDLLASLSEEELLWSPGGNLGPFWKQFRHLGRVQENYMAALDTGVVNFSTASATYRQVGGADKQMLLDYLGDLDSRLIKRLDGGDLAQTIDWFGDSIRVSEHLLRLLSHETLHHGQWIVYCRLLSRPFPESWNIWGL